MALEIWMAEKEIVMKLESLHERHLGLTKPLADSFHEAASVCFARHHNTPADVEVSSGSKKSKHQVEFLTPDQRMLNAWANEIDTTECGAYGVSLAAIETSEGLVAVRRAET